MANGLRSDIIINRGWNRLRRHGRAVQFCNICQVNSEPALCCVLCLQAVTHVIDTVLLPPVSNLA